MRKTTNVPRLKGADFSYRYFHQIFIAAFALLVILVMCIVSESFRSIYNLGNLMNNSFALILAGLGQMLVILTAGIDISVGGMLTLGNCMSVFIMTRMPTTTGMILAILGTIATGLVCGAINGFFIAKLRLPAIIVTIATNSLFQGIALVLVTEPGGNVVQGLKTFFNFRLFKAIPTSFFLAVLVIGAVLVLTNKTRFGRALRAIGGNESAAFGSGVNVEKTKFWAYTLCGLLSALAGLYLAARTSCGDPNIGNNYSVYSISATVVGGTMMTGAVGQAYGTAIGAIVIFLINNVLNMLDVGTSWQSACQGMVLIVSLMIASLETRHRNK